ncbi:MAG: hypothetical protein JXR88_01700 [Clostridia bacterium]|nr:hypothetical protein [Clostridia bacterium]
MFKKKMLTLLLIFVFVFTLIACDKDNETGISNDEKDNMASEVSNDTDKTEKDAEKESIESVQKEKDSFGTLNEITYRVLSSRLLDASEFNNDDSSTKAYLVSMTIENDSNEIFANSALMSFNFYNEKGQDEYGISLDENISTASVDSIAGPGKIIYGEFVLVVDQNTEEVTLEIVPDFMSDDAVNLTFTLGQINDSTVYSSSTDGPGYEATFTDGKATYHVNNAMLDTDGDKTILILDMIVENNTSEEYTSYEIPFKLMTNRGIASKLHYTNTNDTFTYVPANGEKTAQVTYVIQDEEAKEFDLYFAPLGQNTYFDYMHISLN